MSTWLWLAGTAAFICLLSFISLAVGDRERPRAMKTFRATSDAERAFDQRAKKWQRSGIVGLALAVLLAISAGVMAKG